MKTSNNQHRTPNIQSSVIPNIGCSMLDVGCWMLDVPQILQKRDN